MASSVCRILWGVVFLLGTSIGLRAQENLRVWGYVKTMPSVTLLPQTDEIQSDFLVHNRLNVEWNPSEKWKIHAGVRNRVFFGDAIKSEAFRELNGKTGNDWVDLSGNWIQTNQVFATSVLDRAYVEFRHKEVEIRAGRQRINWGMTTVWNPNDVFNAYAFTDFDYEERPGADALQVKYYAGALSGFEFSAKPEKMGGFTAGMRAFFNVKEMDIQLIAGKFQDDIFAGAGFAGNIAQAGVKGEITTFVPYRGSEKAAVSASFSTEYVFANGLFVAAGGLFNSSAGAANSFADVFTNRLSARNLFPFRWSGLIQANGQLNPLTTGGCALVISPNNGGLLFLQPNVSRSLMQNFDVDVFGQLVFAETEPRFGNVLDAGFLRFRWSF